MNRRCVKITSSTYHSLLWFFLIFFVLSNQTISQLFVPKYDPYDIVLVSNFSYDNPYTEVRLWADLQGPQSETYSIEGFWDGGQTWRIRVALTSIGEWNYVTHSNDAMLDGQIGTLECIESNSPGFVTVQGRHFFYDDGTSFFRMGDTCWRAFRSKNAPFETHFKPYIDARAQQGFNFIMSVVHTAGDPSINEGGSLWENDSDLLALQPGYFTWIDYRIDYMTNKGIIPCIFFVWAQTFDEFFETRKYRRNHAFSRFRRYVVSRYAAYNVFWVLSGEYSEENTPSKYDKHAAIIKNGNQNEDYDLLDCGDPYGHPISIHPSGQETNTQHWSTFKDWLSFVMQQMSFPTDELHQSVVQDTAFGLPVCNDEFGYEGPTEPETDPRWAWNNQTGVETRHDAWVLTCSGAYFSFGNLWTYTGREFILNTNRLYSEGAIYMSLLAEFINNGISFHTMNSAQECILSGEAYCLADKGNEYLIYIPFEEVIQVDLQTDHNLKYVWYNPDNGDTLLIDQVSATDLVTLEPPIPSDVVFYAKYDDQPIALKLSNFVAIPEGCSVWVGWQTKNESNTAAFLLERALDDHNFSCISLTSQNDSSIGSERSYSYVDSTTQCGQSYYYRLVEVRLDGQYMYHDTLKVDLIADKVQSITPKSMLFRFENKPNPFNSGTTIQYGISDIGTVDLKIYNSLGQIVHHVQKAHHSVGLHSYFWNTLDLWGVKCPSGVYFCTIEFENIIRVRKLLLVQ